MSKLSSIINKRAEISCSNSSNVQDAKIAVDKSLGSAEDSNQQSLRIKKNPAHEKGSQIFDKSSSHKENIPKSVAHSSKVQDAKIAVDKSVGSEEDSNKQSFRIQEKPAQENGSQIFDKSSSHEEKVSKSVAHFLSCLEEKPARLGSESKNGDVVQSSTSDKSKYHAALRLQKVYKSFRTRRQLADCAIIIEQKWWKVLDLAELKRSSVSFFDIHQHGTALSKWSRARTKAAKVGKGLSKDERARKLALQHWLEAIDPRHRYGHNLQFYYVKWLHCDSTQPFFYWLDIGEGKEVDLERCSRAKLHQQCIKYLGPDERVEYEVAVENGRFIYKKSRTVLDTSREPKGTKCIFVLSTCKILYVGKKVKGSFQHSSFLAGGATLSAGRLVLEDGFLKAVWPHSGHYLPTEENFQSFMSFLMEHKVDLTHVQKDPIDDDEECHQKKDMTHIHRRGPSRNWEIKFDIPTETEPHPEALKEEQKDENYHMSAKPQLPKLRIPARKSVVEPKQETPPTLEYKTDDSCSSSSSGYETAEDSLLEDMDIIYSKMNMFNEDEDEEPKAPTPKEMMVKKINNHRRTRSYQLSDQLSFNWSTGAGPRIGCLRDYPSKLHFRAMEHVNLSPRGVQRLSSPGGSGPIGLRTDLFKFGSLGTLPELPKLGSLPEFNSPVSAGPFSKDGSNS